MKRNRRHHGIPRALLALLTALLAACAPSPGTGPREEVPGGAPGEPAAKNVPAPAAEAPRAVALTVTQYHREFAEHLLRGNAGKTFEGTPPNPLYALVVLRIQLDRDGRVVNVENLRTPAHARSLLRVAQESIARAAPFPRPAAAVALGRPRIEFTETWLFRQDGAFQLRSVALPQDE